MEQILKSIRAFIGAKDYNTSRAFYQDLGFEEHMIDSGMSYFKRGDFGFYLQDYYAKEWVENTMLLLEVEDAEAYWEYLTRLDLNKKYPGIRLIPVKKEEWGSECMLIDPAGVLWHFAEFT